MNVPVIGAVVVGDEVLTAKDEVVTVGDNVGLLLWTSSGDDEIFDACVLLIEDTRNAERFNRKSISAYTSPCTSPFEKY